MLYRLLLSTCLVTACGSSEKSKDEMGKLDPQLVPQVEKTGGTQNNREGPCTWCSDVPQDARFSFTEARLDLGNCKVKTMNLLDAIGGFLAIHRSDCGVGVQLYATKMLSTLKPLETLVLSSGCEANGGSIEGVSVIKGDNRSLLFALCLTTEARSGDVYKIGVDHQGSVLASSVSDNVTDLDDSPHFDNLYRGSWNDRAAAFGVLGPDGFRRYNGAFSQIGGTLSDSVHKDAHISVNDGHWVAISPLDPKCSRITTEGTPIATQESATGWAGHMVGFNGRSMLFKRSGGYNGIVLAFLNPGSCNFNIENEVSTEKVEDITFNWAHGVSLSVASKYDAFFIKDAKNSANLLMVEGKNLITRIAVADNIPHDLIPPVFSEKKIFLPIVREGLAYVSQGALQ